MSIPISPRKVLVLGIGNSLLQDEGVGIHALRRLALDPDPGEVEYLDGGTLSFTLAGPIGEAAAIIVLDAAELGSEPGSVRVFQGKEADAFLGATGKRSVHEVGLLDLFAMAALTDSLPERRALIGIQPGTVGWGEEPSPPVAAALPEVVAKARELIRAWTV